MGELSAGESTAGELTVGELSVGESAVGESAVGESSGHGFVDLRTCKLHLLHIFYVQGNVNEKEMIK